MPSRRQRSFDQPRFGSGAEHQHPVRRDRADERQDNRVADQQQPAKREQDDDIDVLLELFAAGQHLRHHVGERIPIAGASSTRSM